MKHIKEYNEHKATVDDVIDCFFELFDKYDIKENNKGHNTNLMSWTLLENLSKAPTLSIRNIPFSYDNAYINNLLRDIRKIKITTENRFPVSLFIVPYEAYIYIEIYL